MENARCVVSPSLGLLLVLCGNTVPPDGTAGGDPPPGPPPGSIAAPTRSRPPRSGILFEETTAQAGITDVGITFGASVGDMNGDGWPDLFTSGHHASHAKLWRNNANGTFTNMIGSMLPPPTGDLHGAQWLDLDHDGTQELVLLRGANYGLGSVPKSVYRRVGGTFVDVAQSLGLDVPLLRARTPLAVDFDRDGTIDLFLTAVLRPDGQAPPSRFRQAGGVFHDIGGGMTPLNASPTEFGVLGDLDGDHAVDALFDGYPSRAYSFGPAGLTEITAAIGLPNLPAVIDYLVADLTGDGENEIYAACGAARSSAHREGNITIEFHAFIAGDEHGVRFQAPPGHLLWFDWGLANWPASDVHIGAGGWHPSPFGAVLDPSLPANTGIAPHTPGVDHGIWVGWDDVANQWVMQCSAPTWAECLLRCICSHPVSQPTPVGWSPGSGLGDRLLTRVAGTYVDISAAAGIPPSLQGCSVVAADFDNDMDLDLFVVTTRSSYNTADVLLENQGNGTFVPVAAGAATRMATGIGDSVVTLDYDGDGLMDLFVVNGGSSLFKQNGAPGAFGDDGQPQLFHNTTPSTNHWLQLDLVGTASNRDAIGARIEVDAGGVHQVREHGGGMHRYSQNGGLHFGLGDNRMATRVTVKWPSGAVTVLRNVSADQRLVVTE